MGAITTEVVDTGEKRDQRGRRLAADAQRTAMLAAYEQSGLTMAAFARREGIKYATFTGWVYKSPRAAKTKGPIKFAEVQVPATSALISGRGEGLEVRLPDGTVLRGGRVADLAMLVRALRS